MSSSIGPAGLELATLIEGLTVDNTNALYGVDVTFGLPDQQEPQEVVALLGVNGLDEIARVLGPQPNVRDENYGLAIAIKSYLPDSTAKQVWSRGWAMYEAVRAVVLANPTLTGTVSWGLPTPNDSTGSVRPIKDDGTGLLPGWAIRIDLSIICRARS